MKKSVILTAAIFFVAEPAFAQVSFSPPVEKKNSFTSFSPLFPNKQEATINIPSEVNAVIPTPIPPSTVQSQTRSIDTPWIIKAPAECDVQNIDMQFINSSPGLPMVVVSVFCRDKNELYMNYRIAKNISDERLPKAIQVVKDPTIKGRVEW